MRIGEIVVGTDGTPPGGAAVEWAAREAAHQRAGVRVVHAYDGDWRSARFDTTCAFADEDKHLAEAVVNDAERSVHAISPAVQVLTEAVPGDPTVSLLDAAEHADLVVIGSRGRTGLAGLASGKVGRHLIAQAPCPVVVVHGRGDGGTGPVVAGVDMTDTAEHVLETAFAAAADRGAKLVVAHTYLPVAPLWGIDLPSSAVAGPDEDAVEHAHVEDLVARWHGKYPRVPVRILVRTGATAAVLAGLSRDARLIVVGHRGHGVVAGALLGSTGTYLMHHAECPVWIARVPARDQRP
ncbi:universal stress protein [Actinoplanes sp. NPDC049265]|uniref:universal stress protein n=1 Tax=Actinoplanes sp. NPDC049265 TaxID=3363902 RepID=UPI003713F712